MRSRACAPTSRLSYIAYSLTYIYVVLAWVGLYLGIKYYRQLQDETQRALAARTMAHQAQLKMLRYQLNPHFLFNTLNHISTLVRGETESSAGFRHDADNIIEPAREVGDSGAPLTTTDESDAVQGAATGAAIGAVAGLTAGLLSLMVPGFGLVTAGGALAWALGGAAGTAAAGAVAGGIYGGLRDIGIGESHARHYEERIRGGDVLLTASMPTMDEDRIREVLARLEEHQPKDVPELSARRTPS